MATGDLKWLTPEIAEVQAYHRARVAALYRGEAPAEVIAIAGPLFGHYHHFHGRNEIDMLADPEAWLDDVLADMAAQAELAADRVTFRPLVIELDPLGVHLIDALFGAHVYFHEGQVWSDPLECDLTELEPPDLDRSPVWQRCLRLARLATEASQGRLLIATPVFGCPINYGINLFGQRLLEALMERPDVARRALRIITDTIMACTRAYYAIIPEEIRRNSVAESRYAPPGYGQIDGCATHLVSPGQYRAFFAALDEEILAVSPHGGMIHLCGAHAQHIPTWAGMPMLRSVQLNDRAAEDLALYFQRLRPDQIIYVGPTETMTLQRILEISGGRRVVLQCELKEPIRLS